MPDPRPKEDIVSNDELRFNVEEELFWEPRVDNEAIAVSTDDGDVTLRGTVGSFREKREAASAAKRVYASPRSTTSSACDCSTVTGATTPTCAAPCCRC